ncbi:hypothetical protein SLEP1_g12766 [Rubroshorea leprosula]|uniref:Reverse transcriptase domain-containing protein n=1 Tax=Rubroshorea leprosula TaxID=152421 RepID=A0AAV5IDK3_9ROSI|nr:hypothetical protein SLEP1_g12766 [Rubroshorea leprosula]
MASDGYSFRTYSEADHELEEKAYRRQTLKRLIIIGLSTAVFIAVTISAVVGMVVPQKNTESCASKPITPNWWPPPSTAASGQSIQDMCNTMTLYPSSCTSSITSILEGLSGGLLCIWESTVFKMKEVFEGRSFVGVFGAWGEERIPVHFVNIYSPCTLAGKRELWEELGNLINRRKGRWCVGGDFNAVTRVEERAGCKDPTIEMNDFNSFIHDAGLIDLPLIGRKYTWYSSNGRQMSRIDRFLISVDWLEKWGDVKQWGLGRSVSDHCPLVLKNEKVDWGPKPFKFFDAWLEQPDCKELIRKTWNSAAEEGRKGFRLKEKLKGTKKALKEWSGSHMSELDSKIKEAEKMIASLDEKGESVQLSEEENIRRKGCFLDLWKNLRIKERIWRRNELNSIQVNGKQLREVGELKEGVAKYFQDLFTEYDRRRPKLDGINFKQLSHEDNETLMAEFTEVEVKNAVWDCEPTKSPGPDGFNFKFIKAMWEDIKEDIMGYIQEFHERGKMEKGANASFIVLIPKVENPQRIEDYRPISLIGVMYKILAKLLANRLRKVLDKIIGEQQMAFIKGRQLLDGVIIANEVIEEVRRKKKSSFLFKVDFEKAYDKVSWDFIDYMLMRMGFAAKWRKWMKECLQSSTVSILINGSPTRQFSVSKGIRQGDPLSPFLFLIVAEGLNGLMASAVDKNLFKGARIGNVDVTVSHLQFADDTIFFGEASKENIQVIKCVLRTFELASGLKINYGKSQLMGIGVEEDWQKRMAYILHCKEGVLPVKYLGIQIGGNHRKLSMWQPLVNSFKTKLASWKGRGLSMGGRIALINSVLSSLPVFQMSAYLLPKGILYTLDKIRRNFLWGGEGEGKKINWVCWERVCRAKEEGGLGVKDLQKFNVALMGKWLSRKVGSLWWRDIRRLKAGEGVNVRGLWEDFRLKIGEGRGVKFWWDTWCGEECLANKFPRLYLLSTGKEKECHEMGNEDRTLWKWNLSWRRNLLEWEEEAVRELQGMIEGVKITPGCPNRWEWSHSTEGQYSTKIAYQKLSMPRKNPEEEKIFKRVWNPIVPTKVAALNWKTLLDRIPSKLNLIKRGIIKDMAEGNCVLCNEEIEDADHLFLKCKVARGLWQACANWWGTNFTLHRDCWTTFQHFGTWTTKPCISEGWDCIWSTVSLNELANISSLLSPKSIVSLERTDAVLHGALDVCRDLNKDAIGNIIKSFASVQMSQGKVVLSTDTVNDIRVWLNAAVTYQKICLDGLKKVANETALARYIGNVMRNSTEFTSNSLEIASKIMTYLHYFQTPIHNRKLLRIDGGAGARILQEEIQTPDLTASW